MDTVITLIWWGFLISVAIFLFRIALWLIGLIGLGILLAIGWIFEQLKGNKE